MAGGGLAWAWQKRAKEEPPPWVSMDPVSLEGSRGAARPTGSVPRRVTTEHTTRVLRPPFLTLLPPLSLPSRPRAALPPPPLGQATLGKERFYQPPLCLGSGAALDCMF